MSKTLSELNNATHVAEIVNHGEKLILPENMGLDDAISLLERRKEYLTQTVTISETFDAFPWDGAVALDTVLTKRYGWSPAKAIPGFFGNRAPEMINVEVGPNEVRQVPWGRFGLPNAGDGFIQCDTDRKGRRLVFSVVAKVTRGDEPTVRALFDDLRAEIKVNSIYRGKAIKLRFRDDDGDALSMPEPKFINVNDIDESHLIYSADVDASVRTNLFTPIQRAKDCLANGIQLKRGVLLGGTYGTGKTLAAKVAAKLAVENGITYVYVPRADELADAIEFAKQYQSPACVIFCEDIDRAVSGERSVKMDDILNILDGVDTKGANIITVLTTNDLKSINPAMLRPGRLDAVIEVTPPDGPAVGSLLRLYGGPAIAPETDLSGVGEALAGNIPAVIAEVVKRAKLAQLRLQSPGEQVAQLSEAALMEAARTMGAQLKLLKDATAEKDVPPTVEALLTNAVRGALAGKLEEIADTVDDISGRV